MLNKEMLIEWCWYNLQFYNNPADWTDTYIIDIINGYQGSCHGNDGKLYSYNEIRMAFTEYEEEEV